jgi:hypothetical protein
MYTGPSRTDPLRVFGGKKLVQIIERAKLPIQVIKDDAHKLEKGESASIKAPKQTVARQQDVEAAELVNVPTQAISNAVLEQQGGRPASIKDAQASTTCQVQNEYPAESLHEESWLEVASAGVEAARIAGIGPSREEFSIHSVHVCPMWLQDSHSTMEIELKNGVALSVARRISIRSNPLVRVESEIHKKNANHSHL